MRKSLHTINKIEKINQFFFLTLLSYFLLHELLKNIRKPLETVNKKKINHFFFL